jgi:hypothetical protein
MAPPVQKPVPPAKSSWQLPNPANQGCLWGGLQGVLGALVVLYVNDSGFFVDLFVEVGRAITPVLSERFSSGSHSQLD